MKKYNIIWTKNAEFDLESIIEYIKVENSEKAKDIFFKIKEECNKLSFFPKSKSDLPPNLVPFTKLEFNYISSNILSS